MRLSVRPLQLCRPINSPRFFSSFPNRCNAVSRKPADSCRKVQIFTDAGTRLQLVTCNLNTQVLAMQFITTLGRPQQTKSWKAQRHKKVDRRSHSKIGPTVLTNVSHHITIHRLLEFHVSGSSLTLAPSTKITVHAVDSRLDDAQTHHTNRNKSVGLDR